MAPSLKKNVLVCPLDWGLGHATRCVPVIRVFIEKGAHVIIAASDRPLAFLKKEFPELAFIDLPGYNIHYPKNNGMALSMLFSSPRIFNAIRKERKILNKIILENKIDIVVSDNRFGLHSKNAYCIYMTHQVMIKCPPSLKFLEYFLYLFHRSFINKYNECWIPDFEGDINLSGDLSHKYSVERHTFFIGPLSRFIPIIPEEKNIKPVYDVMFILSGPEPQRTIFEEIAIKQASALKHLKFLFVRGFSEKEYKEEQDRNLYLVSHMESAAMRKAILESELIICRPGYSGIMDLARLQKRAVYIPTPGQTEQGYLARNFFSGNLFFCMDQRKFDLEKCILKSKIYPGISIHDDPTIISGRIKYLLEN